MATDVERLTVTLEANLSGFERQMNSAGRAADTAMRSARAKIEGALGGIEDAAGKAAAAAEVATARHAAAAQKARAAQETASIAAKDAADAVVVASAKRAEAESSGSQAALRAATTAEATARRRAAASESAAAAARIAAAQEVQAAQRVVSALRAQDAALSRSPISQIQARTALAVANINRDLNKVGSGRSAGLQNFSFQLQDIIVQVQGGTGFIRALSQQLPQMLGGFGAMGAAAGVAVGLLGGLLTQLDLFGGASKLSADQLAQLNAALDSNKEATQAATEGYDPLIAKLANFTQLQKAAFVVQQQTTLGAQLKELESEIATASYAIQGNISDIRRQMVDMFGGDLDNPELLLLGDRFQDLKKQLESGRLSTEGYIELRDILTQISKTAGPELQATLKGITDQLATTGAKAEGYNQKQKTTQAVIDTVNGAINTNNKALIDQAAKLGLAGDAAGGYAKSMRDAADANEGLSFGERSSRSGFVKVPKPDVGGIPDRPSDLGQAFYNFDPGQLALDKLVDQFLNPGGSRPPKPKKAAAEKRTPADRADSRLDQMKAEIDMNTKLLAAYALGETAMAKIKAQFDAVNAARQSGLKETDKEYASYIANYEAADAENAALEAKLKLMSQGKSLTTEMRTEQEALNAKLVEYKALLDAGAISQTTYERAVAKAKDQNNGYAEGIQAIGDAIEGGIQGATSFNDALIKIGLQLGKLLLQAALFGETTSGGPLGKIFSSLTGLAGGLFGGLGSGSGVGSGVGPVGPGGIAGHAASGGAVGPGIVKVGENGPELLSLSQRGHVTPANATRRALSQTSQSGPLTVIVSGATGNQEVMRMVAMGVARGVKESGKNVPGQQKSHNIRFAP